MLKLTVRAEDLRPEDVIIGWGNDIPALCPFDGNPRNRFSWENVSSGTAIVVCPLDVRLNLTTSVAVHHIVMIDTKLNFSWFWPHEMITVLRKD